MAGQWCASRSASRCAGNSTLAFEAAISLITVFVSNTMTAGAAVAVLSPVVLKMSVAANHDPLIAGFLTAISSASGYLTPAAQPAFTIIYASGYLKARRLLQDRLAHDAPVLHHPDGRLHLLLADTGRLMMALFDFFTPHRSFRPPGSGGDENPAEPRARSGATASASSPALTAAKRR